MESFVRVCSKKDFANNRYLGLADGRSVALFQIDNNYYAISNVCAHMGGPLVDGAFDKEMVKSVNGKFSGEVIASHDVLEIKV